MKQLYMKQKMFSLGEKFSVVDKDDEMLYNVQGSFFKIPKSFSMVDRNEQEIGKVTKELFKFLPKFVVEVDGKETLQIEKELTFFKSKYRINGENIVVEGDWWDMNFEIYRHSKKIATINQKWFAMTSSYEITILNEADEHLIILLVAAIDFVKAEESASASSANT